MFTTASKLFLVKEEGFFCWRRIGGGGRVKNYTVLRLLQKEQRPLKRIHNSNYSHSVSISAKDQVGIYQDKNIVREQFKQRGILFFTLFNGWLSVITPKTISDTPKKINAKGQKNCENTGKTLNL